MGSKDSVESKRIIIMLDKARMIRISMNTLLILEELFETVDSAFKALRNQDDSEKLIVTICSFLYATIHGMTIDEIESALTERNIIEIYGKLIEAVINDMPEGSKSADGKFDSAGFDWDWLYYLGRYRLLMNDDEFWNCTPKRFWKLCSLWNRDHGIENNEPEKVLIDQVNW